MSDLVLNAPVSVLNKLTKAIETITKGENSLKELAGVAVDAGIIGDYLTSDYAKANPDSTIRSDFMTAIAKGKGALWSKLYHADKDVLSSERIVKAVHKNKRGQDVAYNEVDAQKHVKQQVTSLLGKVKRHIDSAWSQDRDAISSTQWDKDVKSLCNMIDRLCKEQEPSGYDETVNRPNLVKTLQDATFELSGVRYQTSK